MIYLSADVHIVIHCEHGHFYASYDDIIRTDNGLFIETPSGVVEIYEGEIYEI